jgi:hypothetical protein
MQTEAANASAQDRGFFRSKPNTNKPMEAEDIEGWMTSLEFAEECGDWDCIESWLNSRYLLWIEKFADARLLARIAEWREKLAEARAHEAIHGKGSLYVKDHPFNVRMEEKLRRRRERLEVTAS